MTQKYNNIQNSPVDFCEILNTPSLPAMTVDRHACSQVAVIIDLGEALLRYSNPDKRLTSLAYDCMASWLSCSFGGKEVK